MRMHFRQEHRIQNEIRTALSHYGVVLRLNSGTVLTDDGYKLELCPPGTPDLLFIGEGYVAWIECKTPKGRVSVDQARFLAKMRALGHRAGVARSVEDALKIVSAETED